MYYSRLRIPPFHRVIPFTRSGNELKLFYSIDNLIETGLTLKRISVVVDEDIVKKLKHLQAKKLLKADGNVSFSQVVNDQLKKSLR